MSFRHVCFISYRNYRHNTGVEKLVKQLYNILVEEISFELEDDQLLDEIIFLDKEGLRCGEKYNKEIARSLCSSACMLLFHTPGYFERPYCRQELQAMQELERARIQNIPSNLRSRVDSLIKPVYYRKIPKPLPDQIAHLQYRHIGRYPGFKIAYVDEHQVLQEIAQQMVECYNILTQHCHDVTSRCQGFIMPGAGPNPNSTQRPFPGR